MTGCHPTPACPTSSLALPPHTPFMKEDQPPCTPPLPQAHEDKHVAEQLQRKEEELGEIFTGKRPVGSSARLAGKQATLTAMAKRLKR